MLMIWPDSWLMISKWLESGCPFRSGRFDKANTSEKSARLAKAGSKRSTDSSVVAEPLVAVPAVEVDVRLENGFRVLLFDKDESARHRVVGDAFEADVSNRRAELHRFYVGPVKHAARRHK